MHNLENARKYTEWHTEPPCTVFFTGLAVPNLRTLSALLYYSSRACWIRICLTAFWRIIARSFRGHKELRSSCESWSPRLEKSKLIRVRARVLLNRGWVQTMHIARCRELRCSFHSSCLHIKDAHLKCDWLFASHLFPQNWRSG